MDRRAFLIAAAATPFVPVPPAARASLLGGTPLALVTADLEAHVVAVELASGRIVGRVPTLADPRSIESVGQSTARSSHDACAVSSR